MYEAADRATFEADELATSSDESVPNHKFAERVSRPNEQSREHLAERLRALQAFSAA